MFICPQTIGLQSECIAMEVREIRFSTHKVMCVCADGIEIRSKAGEKKRGNEFALDSWKSYFKNTHL